MASCCAAPEGVEIGGCDTRCPSRGSHAASDLQVYPEFEKHTVAEFNRLAGFRPATLPKEGHADVFLEEEVQDLPEEFDWRNKDGQNYVDPVISQSCGSCYAVSTVSMINSRIRIQTKNREKPVFPYHQVRPRVPLVLLKTPASINCSVRC